MNAMNTGGPACPIPISEYPHILLAHGGGGRLMHQLID
jgi:hydrogenase expression/formation protein HypE